MKAMVKVSIADVLGIENTDEEMARTTQQFVVVLKQDGGNRAFPIWVGPARARRL
jgi:bifunctional DNase/RNase